MQWKMTLKPKTEASTRGCVAFTTTFCVQAIIFGISTSIGLYNVYYVEIFDGGFTTISLVGSLNLGILLGSGPLTSGLMSTWSPRKVAIFGAILSSIGLSPIPFAPNLEFIYVFYGVFTGLGYSVLYIPSLLICGYYFPRRRRLTRGITGIVSVGGGFWSFIFPIIIRGLIELFGHRSSMFILAGINLHLIAFCYLMKPCVIGTDNGSDENEHSSVVSHASGEKVSRETTVYTISGTEETTELQSEEKDNTTAYIRSRFNCVSHLLYINLCVLKMACVLLYTVSEISTGIPRLELPRLLLPNYLINKGNS